MALRLVKSRSSLESPPYLQVLSGAPVNALAESGGTLLNSRGIWQQLAIHRGTGEVARSVWED